MGNLINCRTILAEMQIPVRLAVTEHVPQLTEKRLLRMRVLASRFWVNDELVCLRHYCILDMASVVQIMSILLAVH